MKRLGTFIAAMGGLLLWPAPTAPAQNPGIFEKTADWAQRGSTKIPGSVTVTGTGTNAVYEMKGNGDDIWDNQDEGFFVYKELAGSWSLRGKVQWIDPGPNDWAKIGVMIREKATLPQSRHYWIELRGAMYGDRTDSQWRATEGGSSSSVEARTPEGDPVQDPGTGLYLRVTRIVPLDLVFSEYSFDGKTWQLAHSMTMPLPETVAYGLAITNHDDNDVLAHGTVTDVALEQAPPIGSRSFDPNIFTAASTVAVTITVLNPGSAAQALKVTETLPVGWAASDIGQGGSLSASVITWNITAQPGSTVLTYKAKAPAAPTEPGIWRGTTGALQTMGVSMVGLVRAGAGDFPYAAEIIPVEHPSRGAAHWDGQLTYDAAKKTYLLAGNGWDIQENGDECFFVYRTLKGSWRLEATVEWQFAEHEWAKAGLMCRESTSGHSAQTNIITSGHPNSPDRWEVGTRLSYNAGYSPTSWANLPESMYGQPTRLALTRLAPSNQFIREWFNTETNQWVALAVTIDMPEEVLVGLAVTSHIDTESWAEALFSNVVLTRFPFTVSRSLSATSVAPGGTLDVKLSVAVEAETPPNFTITETYPKGWKVSKIKASAGDAKDDGTMLSWKATAVTAVATLTYTLTVPPEAAGKADISGTYDDGAGFIGTIVPSEFLIFDFKPADLGIFNGHMDIGSPGAAGSVGRAGNDWAVIGSGHDIWDSADDFHFLYKRVQGNFKMSIENAYVGPIGEVPTGSTWAKMGIMARQSLTAPSAYAYAMIRSQDQAFSLQWREEEGIGSNWDGDATQTYVPDHHGAFGLERVGNDFTAFYIDATGAEVVNNIHYVEMTDPIWLGIAVTSHETGSTAVGLFSNVKFQGTAVSVREWMLY